MGYKLSIVQRQYNMTGWHQSKQFDVPGIQKVKVDGAGKGKSLNAVPSPFARMHLFETAFEMVYQDLINNTNLAGEAYNKLVSECLDVFELIFNWESHIKDGKNLEISTWSRQTEIYNLMQSQNKQHKLLGQTLDVFLQGETAFQGFENCLLIKYNGDVIAGTSPFTGFITTPDELTNKVLLKPLSQIAYFSRIIPFQERKPEIRKYIYDFFESNPILRDDRHTRAIRDFLEYQRTASMIPSYNQIDLKDIVSGGTTLVAFGQNLLTSRSIGTEYFEKQIIRLNYRLNDHCFYLPRISNNERTYDYLLPLTASFFEVYKDVKQIEQLVSFVEGENSVEVKLHINGKIISKKFQEKPIHETNGKIIDLFKDHQIIFNLGIFPFLKIVDQFEGANFNDFYRIMLTYEDLDYRTSNKNLNLKFGKDGLFLEDGTVYKIKSFDRTILEKNISNIGSKFFSLNTCFDFIQVELPILQDGLPVRGIIIPNWKEKSLGDNKIDFAIDFGTTSTFVAYNFNDLNRSLEFDENELPVGLLNKPKAKGANLNIKECYENVDNTLRLSIGIQKQEFLPSIIKKISGNKSREDDLRYTFPIRSAVYEIKAIPANQKKTLQNSNISFIYQTKDVSTLSLKNQEFRTNLKWNIKIDPDTKSSIEVFIEELLILIRTKILLISGDPRKSNIYWFCPLSFTNAAKNSFSDLWNKHSQEILMNSKQNVYNLSESETPFYFLSKSWAIKNPTSVLTLDIGGGSTDTMLFESSESVFGTSVHFGANILWGNGYNDIPREKRNGIYLKLKEQVFRDLSTTELEAANEAYCADGSFASSDEIINFWLAHDNLTKATDKLNHSDFRLSYLLHLCAIVYHNLKLIKIKNRVPPTCIIFSGNGSKYVDLIGKVNTIEKIWGFFARKLFNENIRNPQVILPSENRKEATCYGGLYLKTPNTVRTNENYLGFENSNEKYFKYRDIENNQSLVFTKTLGAFNEFIEWFFQMNDTTELNFRNEFGITTKISPLKKFLIDIAYENLLTGYRKRLEQVDLEDPITDSIFYYPLIALIFIVNEISPEDLDKFVEKTVYYFNGPDGEGEFLVSQAHPQVRGDSIYTITVENDSPNSGTLKILDDENLQKRALMAYQGFIDPVCSYEKHPKADQKIKTISAGKVRRDGDKWIITEKINIEFV